MAWYWLITIIGYALGGAWGFYLIAKVMLRRDEKWYDLAKKGKGYDKFAGYVWWTFMGIVTILFSVVFWFVAVLFYYFGREIREHKARS